MNRPRRAALLLVVLTATAAARTSAQEPEPVPEPYTREEFGASMHALRRAEIVAVGAFPFTLLLSIFAYDYARWAGQGFVAEAAPFRRPPGEDPFNADEKVGIAIGAAAAAVAIALADYLLGRAEAEQPREPDPPASDPRLGHGPSALPLSHDGVLPVSLATVMAPATAWP